MPSIRSDCFFCGSREITDPHGISGSPEGDYFRYRCKICGYVYCAFDHISHLQGRKFTDEEKKIICINLREGFERRGKTQLAKPLTITNLNDIIYNYRPLDPLEKLDKALEYSHSKSDFIGEPIYVNQNEEYPCLHSFDPKEVTQIYKILADENYIKVQDKKNPHAKFWLTAKGYQRLSELKKPSDSNKCFVAMWFNDEMDRVYEEAIKPAIEYKDDGAENSTYEAILIKDVQHTNDINDEIIAQIRRSRFMVCDLTGYRGGVYFEAGFAYGLGLEVIYTCRKDWTNPEDLTNEGGQIIKHLIDSNKNQIRVKKEGVHFDLSHRRRIEWEPNNLEKFQKELENCIKAVIV
jgi:nucleoside 2-deoxyribosyltransferase